MRYDYELEIPENGQTFVKSAVFSEQSNHPNHISVLGWGTAQDIVTTLLQSINF